MQRMRESGCTIVNFPWCSSGSIYQFFKLWGMIWIGTRSGTFKEANGIVFMPWIALEVSLQFWVSLTIFQVCSLFFCAAWCSSSLGLWPGICSESIRSRKTAQIQCIHDFWKFDSKDLFHIFFHATLCQSGSNQTKSSHIDLCTKYWRQNMHEKIY